MRATALSTALLSPLLLPGCSLLLDFDSQPSVEESSACTRHSDCRADGDTEQYCVMHQCTSIDSGLCNVDEDLEDPDAELFHLGMLMPLSGPNGSKGQATVDGALVAINQINKVYNGVRGTKLSLIACDTEGATATAVATARHLTEDVGVRAIIGSLASDSTIAVATNVTVPNQTLLVSPSSTSPIISSLEDDDLVWRVISSDELQGRALAYHLEDSDFSSVAVLYANTAYGNGLFNVFTDTLIADGRNELIGDERFRSLAYTMNGGELDVEGTIQYITDKRIFEDGFAPDAVFVMGSVESQQLIAALDDTYLAEASPTWILTDAGRESGLLSDNLAPVVDRIVGTSPAEVETSVTQQFEVRFEASSSIRLELAPFADNAYDAAYVIALAVGAQDNLFLAPTSAYAEALKRISDPTAPSFAAGDSIDEVLAKLQAGATINFVGASGEVDFNPDTGDVTNPIELWKVENGAFVTDRELIDADGKRVSP